MAHFVSQKDEDNCERISRASNDQRGGHCQNEKNNMDGMSSHEKQLFLFLMTVAVELFLVLMFPHLFTAFLDHASHDLASFPHLQIM